MKPIAVQGRSFRVRCIPASDIRGKRLSAVDTFGKGVRIGYDWSLSHMENVEAAAVACSYACGLGRPIAMTIASAGNDYVVIATKWESGYTET